MPLNKPNIGQSNWGPVLNAALDYLDAKEATASTADFVFSVDEDGAPSRMTVTDHDMTLQTVRVDDAPDSDCDINIEAADDVFVRAYGDEVGIYAKSTVAIRANNYDENGNLNEGESKLWEFQTGGGLQFPDNTVQTTAYTGGASGDLIVPVTIKDSEDADFITFSRTSTGTARIATPQDDLSLRSARDITLIAGSDGPGNVYIGWGDATINPDASNRVATIGDIETAPKTYTANNEARYGTYQASGFIEVTPDSSTTLNGDIYTLGGASNVDFVNFSVGGAQHNVLNGDSYIRRITISDESGTVRFLRNPGYVGTTEGGQEWSFECDLTLNLLDATTYTLSIEYGGAPVIWWDADNENPTNGDFTESNFRGAKIEYHAYLSDAGTVVGTIYIARDSGNRNVTHIETSSGGTDTGTAIFWDRSGTENQLKLLRTDGESVLHKIQWTAQMYYATEFYDD